MVVGSDLRTADTNAAWKQMNLPGTGARERVDKLFAGSDVAASVLDVLASGESLENVIIRLPGDVEIRFLRLNFHPLPNGKKPRKVKIEAWEMSAQVVLDGETGKVLGANRAASEVFGDADGAGQFVEGVNGMEAALTSAARNGSCYLGRFTYRRPDGREVVMESMLTVVGA
jgi:hypothetical protein